MFKKRNTFFIFLLFSLLSTFCSGNEQNLSLKECIDLSLKNSKMIASSKAEVSVARASKNEALSSLLPHLSLDGKYEEKNTARDFSVFTEYGGSFSTQTIGVMANCLLFDFGGAWNQLRAEKRALLASENLLGRTNQQIEEEATIYYFRILETSQMIHVLQESISILNEQLKITADFFQQGIVSKSDPLFVQVKMEEKKKALLRAKTEHSRALMDLNRLMGKDLLNPLIIQDIQEIPHLTLSLETLQRQALQNRLDLQALKNQVDSLHARKSAAKAAYAPRFYAFGGYSYLHDSTSNENHWISGGLGLQFSLYDGGKTSATSKKFQGQMEDTQAQKEDLATQILLETNNLFLQFREQLENIAIDKTSLELSQENLRTTTDRYKQGLASIRDLLAAEEQLTASRMGQMRSIYQAQIVWAKLFSATGGF